MRITAFDKKGERLVAATVENGRLISITYHSFEGMRQAMLADPGACYVCEHSHATAKRFSKSQFWFPSEIQELLDRGVNLRVVAEAVTGRKLYQYRVQITMMGFPVPNDQLGWKEKDEAVACALALHAADVGHHTLARLKLFDGTFDPLQQWAHEQRDDINQIWEILRNYADWDPAGLEDYDGLPEDRQYIQRLAGSYNMMCDWLEGGGWRNLPQPELFEEILLGGAKPTPAVVRGARKRVAAVWYCVFGHDGQRRLFKDKPLGVNKTLRYLLSMKEFHRRSGSHRAQVYWHSLRGSIRKQQGCTSPKSYTKFDEQDWQIHTEQKRKFRRLMHDMVALIGSL